MTTSHFYLEDDGHQVDNWRVPCEELPQGANNASVAVNCHLYGLTSLRKIKETVKISYMSRYPWAGPPICRHWAFHNKTASM